MSETTTPVEAEKRSRRYPVIVTQALGPYLTENFDVRGRTDRARNALSDLVRTTIGVDANVVTIKIAPAVDEGETWTAAILGVMFTNVTRSELADYAAKIEQVLGGKTPAKRLIESENKDAPYPAPDVFVPTAEWIRQETSDAQALAAKSKELLNADGTINKASLPKRESAAKHAAPAAATQSAEPVDTGVREDGTYAEADELF